MFLGLFTGFVSFLIFPLSPPPPSDYGSGGRDKTSKPVLVQPGGVPTPVTTDRGFPPRNPGGSIRRLPRHLLLDSPSSPESHFATSSSSGFPFQWRKCFETLFFLTNRFVGFSPFPPFDKFRLEMVESGLNVTYPGFPQRQDPFLSESPFPPSSKVESLSKFARGLHYLRFSGTFYSLTLSLMSPVWLQGCLSSISRRFSGECSSLSLCPPPTPISIFPETFPPFLTHRILFRLLSSL